MSDRVFRNFYFYCGIHDECFNSLESFTSHRKASKTNKNNIKVICGCCGDYFSTASSLSSHHNVGGFKFRESTIPNFDKENFNYRQQFLFKSRQSNVTPQAATCRDLQIALRHSSDNSSYPPVTFARSTFSSKRMFVEEELDQVSFIPNKMQKMSTQPSTPEKSLAPPSSSSFFD